MFSYLTCFHPSAFILSFFSLAQTISLEIKEGETTVLAGEMFASSLHP